MKQQYSQLTKAFTRRAALAMVGCALALGAAPRADAQEFYRLSTLGPGSSPYLVMSTFAQFVNERLPEVSIQVNATGAATQHALEAAAGRIDFFMSSPTVHAAMMQGGAMYAQIPNAAELSQDLRSLLSFPIGVYHIVTYADSGIETLADIKGKRVFLGPPGGGATTTMTNLVRAVTGYEPGTDFESVAVGWDAAAQAFQDGRLDVYINPTNAPSPVIEQMAVSRPIRLIGLTEEEMAKPAVATMLNRPGGTLGGISAGTYGANQMNEEDVVAVGTNVGIGTGKHRPEEEIYQIVKAFWETVHERRSTTPWLRNISLETALDDLNMPLHPGAERFYREAGFDIPDALLPPK